MLRLALRSVLASKLRFVLTSGAVMIGVAFVVTAFVTADSLRATFDQLASDINTGSDFTVRGEAAFGEITDVVAPPVPAEILDDIRAVDGVDIAEGGLFVPGVIPQDGEGTPVFSRNGPTAGSNWTTDETLSQFFLVDGRWPVGIDEFALGASTYSSNAFVIGNEYEVATPTGTRTFTLTGTMQFGFPEDASVGAVFSLFDTATAQTVLGLADQFTQISVRAETGTDLEALRARIEAVLPSGTEVISAEESVEEFSDALGGIISTFQTVLLVFAFVVLFVSAFIISNAFNIVLGQRVRELSLLRAIGATPRQVLRSVLAEAVFVGVVAVVVGLGLGMLGALGLRELFAALDLSLPDGPLPLKPRTVAWAAAVGIGFTIVAAMVPAVKAARLSPVAGLSEDFGSASTKIQPWRVLLGAVLLAGGLILTLGGLFWSFEGAAARLWSLGAGSATVFVAVSVLSPLIAGHAVSVLARPLKRLFGIAGNLAGLNAARNPRRTAATAIALTIGLALVSLVSIMGASFKATFHESLRSSVNADFVVTSQDFAGLPGTVASDLRATGVGSVVAFAGDLALVQRFVVTEDTTLVDAHEVFFNAVNVDDLPDVANLDIESGSLDDFDSSTSLLIHNDVAEDLELTLGDEVPMTFVSGDTVELTVAAIYSNSAFWGNWLIDQSLHERFATSSLDDAVAIKVSGTDLESARERLESALADYPATDLDDRSEFQEDLESNLNTLLILINVFLLFALVVALVGIVNTLTLSVFERTREIGLLRSVGMSRVQLRRMIRWEAATVALYGALVGVALGTGFGIALVTAIPDDIIGQLDVPVLQMVLFVAIATIMGLLAALLPSLRAGRMNVLDAISSN